MEVSSAGEALQALTPSEPPLSPPAELTPKPSKRLFIRADFKWKSEADRTLVLMELCEAMSQNRLDRPFWIKNFLIHPTGQSVEGSGAERCIQYHVNISRSTLKPRKSTALRRQVGAVSFLCNGAFSLISHKGGRNVSDWLSLSFRDSPAS